MRFPLVAAAACLLSVSTQACATTPADEVDRPAAITQAGQPASEVLTLEEAAGLLRVDVALLEWMASLKRLPGRQIGTEWRFSRSALLAWLADGADAFGATADADSVGPAPNGVPPSARRLSAQASARIIGRGATPAKNESTTVEDGPDQKIGEAPQQRTASEVFLREQRLLLAPKELTWDIGAFYTRRDATVLTRVGDATVLANAESNAFTTQVIARYGLRRNTELFASTSYSRQRASIYSGAQRLSQASRSEAGDIGLGVRQTLIEEGLGRPDVIVGLDARIPTGDTSPALGTSVSLVKSVDPVVLFGTLGYRHTFSREFEDISRLEPRHRIDLTLGYSFALNDTLSINSAIASSFTRATTFANAQLRSTNTSNLQLGMTARIAKGIYLQPSVSVRLSGPSRGYTFGLNVPITF